MYEIRYTETYLSWYNRLKDANAIARIGLRLKRVEAGNFGDVKSVGGGISEMRIDYGPGYRIYFTVREKEIVFLLAGGDKRTQTADIKLAIELAETV